MIKAKCNDKHVKVGVGGKTSEILTEHIFITDSIMNTLSKKDMISAEAMFNIFIHTYAEIIGVKIYPKISEMPAFTKRADQ